MAAITADTVLSCQGKVRKQGSFIIKDGVQLYVGGICKFTSGYADIQVAAASTIVAGIAVGPGNPGNNLVLDGFTLTSLPVPMIAKGNQASAAAGNENRVILEQGELTLRDVKIAIAGNLNGNAGDVGQVLYAPTSNVADLTTTQTSTDKPFGEVAAYKATSGSTGTYDVLVYSYEARRGM